MTIKDKVLQDLKIEELTGNKNYLKEVIQNGYSSGIVKDLIYSKDTLSFYEIHKEEINNLVKEIIDESGSDLKSLFSNWDDSDPLALETTNRNILAWFGYEYITQKIIIE